MDRERRIGIIAGYGILPLKAVNEYKNKGCNVTVIALKESCTTVEELRALADNFYEYSAGQAGKILKTLKKNCVESVLLTGKVEISLLNSVKFDLKAVMMLAKLKIFSTDTINDIIINELKKTGMSILSQKEAYSSLLAEPCLYSKRGLDEALLEDIYEGFNFAKKSGSLDLGQSIVIGKGRILAIETAEGTDKTFARGCSFSSNAVCVKTGKPYQNEHYDLPTIGINTLQTIKENGGSYLVIESGETIIIDLEECIEYADRNNMVILSVSVNDIEEKNLKKYLTR